MKTWATIAARLVFAAASIAGVITQLVIAVQTDFGLVNFFSYFTTLGNLFASVVFVVGAIRLMRGTPGGAAWQAVRGASVVYLAFIGIVFNTLLLGADLGGLMPWVNVVHHMLMPLVVVIDWLVWPPTRRLSVRIALLWVVVPVVYTVYSLVRGAAVGFYCYPFFNPAAVGGYGGVAAYCAALLVAFVALAFAVRAAGNALGRRAGAGVSSGAGAGGAGAGGAGARGAGSARDR
ncbi:Pr6Pr family membrane protein [Frigoribacterium sp. 2-23]|uniref:Pr6Pr family membrane protein n=1 Tax=Frigoribacterium sp. 2-23 TaxID=3415006 RepID=UPI003C6FBF2A